MFFRSRIILAALVLLAVWTSIIIVLWATSVQPFDQWHISPFKSARLSASSAAALRESATGPGGCCQLSESDTLCVHRAYAHGCRRLHRGETIRCVGGFWNPEADFDEKTGHCAALRAKAVVQSTSVPNAGSNGCCQVSKRDGNCAEYEYVGGLCKQLEHGEGIGCSRGFWNRLADYDPKSGRCVGPGATQEDTWDSEDNKNVPDWIKDAFNIPADVRHDNCLENVFPDTNKMPTVTIVIPYLMEAWPHIHAAVASLVWATNMDLIDEVRFVDDANPDDHKFKAQLEALHPKVRVISNEKRLGLTHSKVVGARDSNSAIIIFLEPHCIFARYWLEPLLQRMMTTAKSTVVLPVIDVIKDPYTEERPAKNKYAIGGLNVGMFTVPKMTFGWLDLRSFNASYKEPEPFASPAMPGGIFAMWRSYWEESGTYDTAMGEWGGENIEMSIRIWTCGGRIEIVPCSHIYHWFRPKRPYSFHGEVNTRNNKRTAEVWLDEFKTLYYQDERSALDMDPGDLSDRVALRKRLNCKPFRWYIEDIFPEAVPEVYRHGNFSSLEANKSKPGIRVAQNLPNASKSNHQDFVPPPDFRHDKCKLASYGDLVLPTVTIVIPYLMERWFHVKATVASILSSTNMTLVDEIRFIDDANPEDHKYKAELETMHPKIKVISNQERIGLTRSKMVGATNVSSPVIIFLEPHCVFSVHWLEPLLARMVHSPRTTVVEPLIDIITEPYEHNITPRALYSEATLMVGSFKLSDMRFNWKLARSYNKTYQAPDALATPAMPGGIFAIWRSWWEDSGEYDAGMDEWGGENIEMSIRVWTCGGRLEIVPCSRLFHLFRKARPYEFHQVVETRNRMRVAEVWLDEYKDKFVDGHSSSVLPGNVSDRVALRERLKCKPFSWYVKEVFPDLLDET